MIKINYQCSIREFIIIMMNKMMLNYHQEANIPVSKQTIIITIIKISDRCKVFKFLKRIRVI